MSFWQFGIIVCSVLDNYAYVKHVIVNIKTTRMISLSLFLRAFYLLSLLRPILTSVGGFAISSDGYFFYFILGLYLSHHFDII